MNYTPDDLKEAASAEKAEIEARVRGKQGGIATYFDVFLFNFLKRLENTGPIHGWNASAHGPNSRHSARAADELQWLATYLERRQEGRFVSYGDRLRGDEGGRQSDIRSPERSMSQGTAECLTWKGSPLFKSVFDFAILPMLLWELKPGTVFEIGSGTGTSAGWIADLLHGFGLSSPVYSTDINPIRASYPGVHFLAGDTRSPATLFGSDLLRAAARPFLIVEDAHVNAGNVFLYFDDFLIQGDYLFVEDSLKKGDALNAFLTERPNRYAVDTRYTDFFGRNATSAINSILVRI
jgi:cephalosporin hydroxylase